MINKTKAEIAKEERQVHATHEQLVIEKPTNDDEEDEGFDSESDKSDEHVVNEGDIKWLSTDDEEKADDDEMKDNNKSIDIEETNDEIIDLKNDDQEMTDAEKIIAEKLEEEKGNKEQTKKEQANDDQAQKDQTKDNIVGTLVTMSQKEKPKVTSSSSILSLSSNYEESSFNCSIFFYSCSTSSKAAESLSELELKQLLFDKMDKSKSYLTHDKHQELYDSLLNLIILDEAVAKRDVYPQKFKGKETMIDKLTKANFVGPVYKLLKGTYRSFIELEYNIDQFYLALTNQLDRAKPEGKRCPYDLSKPLPLKGRPAQINWLSKHDVFSIMRILSMVNVKVDKKFGYGYLEEIVVRRVDHKLHTFKECDFKNLHLNDIKDMLILHVQNMISNLEVHAIVDLAIALRMFT
nr:hypothetical protein [Tanacetum cinerariifolium]